ncbi:MAG: Crp/Fnr family transcriptional regulator [Treponema sp.]|nr:Crp/Fnr family transcriptional regulator [Treponema sp.]
MSTGNNAAFNFKKQIGDFASISEEQIDLFLQSTVKETYKRNEYFSTIEKPSESIAFVARGLFRVYIIDRDGNEATLNFRGEDMPMSSYGAVLLGQLEPVFIQALEDSEILTMPRTEVIKHWENDTRWKVLLQKFTELDCLQLRRREFSFLQDDAKTRYINFYRDFNRYASRIKLRYIASYLGITPEALSRIRSSPLKAVSRQ